MSRIKKARGRPKGSGLDDSAHLDAIARLIAANPDLKPTTAIKKLGISDPSAVRRLRDKYRLEGGSHRLCAEQGPGKSTLRSTEPKQSRVSTGGTASAVVASGRGKTRSERPQIRNSSETSAAGAASVAAHEVPPQEWLSVWGGLGIQALAASVDFQLTMAGHAMRWPAISAALRQQIFLSELAMSFCGAPSSRSETLH